MTRVYIARITSDMPVGPAGTIIAAGLYDPDTIKGFVDDGLVVERVPIEWARGHFMTTDQFEGEA